MQFLFMLLGCIILALGIWIQFKGGVAMLPGEAMNRAISKATGKKYENVKIVFDILYIVVAAVICLVFNERHVHDMHVRRFFVVMYNRIYDRLTRHA